MVPRLALVLFAGCGRLAFDANPGGDGVIAIPDGADPLQSTSLTESPPDLTGDGNADIAIVDTSSEGSVALYSIDPASIGMVPVTVELYSSSECGSQPPARYVALRGFGTGFLYGYDCSLDAGSKAGLGSVFAPQLDAVTSLAEGGPRLVFGEQQPALWALALGDIDGDGALDAVSGQGGTTGIRIILDLANRLATVGTTIPQLTTTDGAGSALALIDVTGDGVLDLAIGAPAAAASAGVVYVIPGPLANVSSGPLADVTAFTLTGPAGSRFGSTLAAWDANRDGEAELVVGAPGGAGANGAIYLWSQITASGATSTARWQIDATSALSFGAHLATRGDVNKDGGDDLIVGSSGGGGAVHVFASAPGFASDIDANAVRAHTFTGPVPSFAAEFVGDLDGDGVSDIAVARGTTAEIFTAPVDIPRWTVEGFSGELSLVAR